MGKNKHVFVGNVTSIVKVLQEDRSMPLEYLVSLSVGNKFDKTDTNIVLHFVGDVAKRAEQGLRVGMIIMAVNKFDEIRKGFYTYYYKFIRNATYYNKNKNRPNVIA